VSDYSSRLIDHFSNPRNIGALEDADARAVVKNAFCGDQIHISVRLLDDLIVECGFLAYGCAASLATGSILTEAIRGMHIDDVGKVDERRVAEWAGGYSPGQMHCAQLAKELLGSLARNHRDGRATCPGGDPPACCEPA
jgi:NifU-like protein involved in Fe-S cluster formation